MTNKKTEKDIEWAKTQHHSAIKKMYLSSNDKFLVALSE